MSLDDLDGLRQRALEYARVAGEITLRYYRANPAVETKHDDTPVTQADREAEAAIRLLIKRDFPTHGVLGEEAGYQAGVDDVTWVIDPIDGTRSFVAGVPLYTVLIAVVDGILDTTTHIRTDRVVAGVIHAPAAGETVSAARGCGAIWERWSSDRSGLSEEPARVADTAALSGARVMTTDWASLAAREPDLFSRIGDGSSIARTWGDAYGYLLVATGRADLMVDPIMSAWDIGPLPVVIEEAGGYYSTVDGEPIAGASSLATTPGIARELGLPDRACRSSRGVDPHDESP